MHTNHAVKAAYALLLPQKTFCGIILCYLDAPAIIKRNGIEFYDFSRIVKYAYFSILLLFFFLFHMCRA